MSESCFTYRGVGFAGRIISRSQCLTENASGDDDYDDDDDDDDEAISSATMSLLMEWRNEVKRKKK